MKAACAKKQACNPPVKAAVETADRHTDLLVQAVEAGEVSEAKATDLILAYAFSDDRYVAEQKTLQGKVIEALGGLPSAQKRGGSREAKGE